MPTDPARRLFSLSIGVFFIGGFLSSLVNLFVPRLTLLYGLDYTQALLVQLAFHLSYLVFAVPIGVAIVRLGYMRSAATGLAVMAMATLFLLAAHGAHSYALILAALLALSAGITVLQIAANTVVAVVGGGDGAAFRLTFLQTFNSIGTVVAPLAAAPFVLDAAAPRDGPAAAMAISPPFLVAVGVLIVLAIAFALLRDLLNRTPEAETAGGAIDWRALAGNRRLVAGAAAIFAYVGAEVTIGALLANYLADPAVLGASPIAAARLVSLYWAGAMLGRAVGAFVMRRVAPAQLLALAALGAGALTAMAATIEGPAGGVALIGVGLCNSIMYPTIYVLALPRDPALATPGATVLCMAVVGGAIVPLLTGVIADGVGLAAALALPALCYLAIAAFARAARPQGSASRMVVTIKHVAEAAGVSAKTVSRVINGEAHVAVAKREAVMRVVRELDYRPNAFARSLSSSRSYLLGLLIDDPASGYAAEVQLGAINACRDKSYHLLVERVDRAEPDWARSLRATLDQLRLDGALLTPPLCDDPQFLDLLDEAGLPYVRIAPGKDDARSGFVRMDDAAAAAEMTRHLVALGHRRIGFIAGKPTHAAAAKRLDGFNREMAAHGLAVDPALVHPGDFSVRSGMVAGEAILARQDRPSAIFAANDDMALGLLMIAYRHHLDVPADLAIAGFDDAATARAAWPPITTIIQPNGAMAAAAVDILASPRYRDDPHDPAWRRLLDYRLVVRGSTDAGVDE